MVYVLRNDVITLYNYTAIMHNEVYPALVDLYNRTVILRRALLNMSQIYNTNFNKTWSAMSVLLARIGKLEHKLNETLTELEELNKTIELNSEILTELQNCIIELQRLYSSLDNELSKLIITVNDNTKEIANLTKRVEVLEAETSTLRRDVQMLTTLSVALTICIIIMIIYIVWRDLIHGKGN